MQATEGIQIDDYSSHGNNGHPLEGHLREMLEQHDSFIDRRRKAIRRSLIVTTLISMAIIVGLAVGLSHKHSRNAANELKGGPNVTTSAPTTASVRPESLSRADKMRNFLMQKISDPQNLDLNTTAQARAAHWMVEEDDLHLDIPILNDEGTYRFLERYVMAVFHFALQEKQLWGRSLNFLTGNDICRWNAPDSANGTESERTGVMCRLHTGGGDVSTIRIIDNNLTGTLPPELGLLTRLRRLSLHNNLGIRGSIPDSFQNLRNLEIVTLQINKLTGSIPDWLGRWTGLQVLGLNTNRLTGLLPASLNQLTQLTNLALDNNRLSGEIGVLQTLTNLKMLFLDNNQFRGQLGYDAFQNHRALVHLGLSDNDFVGTLPLYLFQVENLAVLDLHGNFFTGVLPEFATNDALQFLALHDNDISESVPSSITNLHALTHLDLARNNLTQAMPEIFDSMTNLDSLFLSDNPFTAGPIPDLSTLANLKYLSIKATHRTGVIPTWIGKLDNLLSVDLGSNGLRARLPSEMGSLENLAYLLLNENFLTGSIPDTFTQLTKLKLILIENNTITGSTTSVCALPAISTFVSDCMGPVAELECTCCKPCCHDASPSCGDTDAVNQVNSIWEVGYGRNDKDFNGEIYDS